MTWQGDTNQSGPLPTGTLTATVHDASCPTGGCIYTHTITASDYQWAFTGTWSWSIHFAFCSVPRLDDRHFLGRLQR